jgi:subtilisin family serine protease
MKSNYLLILLAVSIFTISCENDISDTPVSVQNLEQGKFVPNQVLIKFKDGDKYTGRIIENALSLIEGNVIETINTSAMRTYNARKTSKSGEFLLVSSKLGTSEAIEILKNLSSVEYAEPNWIYQHFATSNDTYYTNGSLWGMYGDASTPANQFGSQAAEAWTNGNVGSNTVYIGIIDEGYMYTHEDLAANAGTNTGEVPNNGIDDDKNGLIDDVYGWDFDGNNNTVFDGVDDDHGTHVAGTIGGVGGNGKGVAGVVWNVKLLSAKFLGINGGTTANAIKSVDYFTDLKQRGFNIVATNNSWGGGGFSQGLYDAIERANLQGILFVAAAGNATNNNDASPSYPASYLNANIITVASITNTGALSSFSNYGATSVDIGAPGSGIFSTVPVRSKGKVVSGYASYNGTSMATPHVTGAAALYASSNPGASVSAVKNAILSSAAPTTSLSNKCVTGARLNVSGF